MATGAVARCLAALCAVMVSVQSQETSPVNRTCPRNPELSSIGFLNIGHSGGDPLKHCENTLEAGSAGLAAGMNSVELDVCMSRDGVLFLWHDCNMYDSLSMLRRLGRFAPNSKCLPYHHPSTYNKQPHQLTFATIQSKYGYKREYDNDNRLHYRIPTLRKFFRLYGSRPQIKRIYIDSKVFLRSQVTPFVNGLLSAAREFGIESKLLLGFMSRDIFEYAKNLPVIRTSRLRMVYDIGLTVEEIGGKGYLSSLRSAISILEEALEEDGEVGYWSKAKIYYYLTKGVAQVAGHSLLNMFSLYNQQVAKRQPVKHAQDLCIGYVSLGTNPLPVIGGYLYKRALQEELQERRQLGYPCRLVAWTINDEETLRWVYKSGTDAVITDKPRLMKRIMDGKEDEFELF